MLEPINLRRETIGNGESLLLHASGAGQLPVELARLCGQVQCVYMDPPFMTGDSFVRRRRFGARGWRTGSPAPKYPSYSDRFADRDTYLRFLRGLVANAHRLLAPTGVLCLHLDWRTAAHARLLCDEVFGEELFLNEIIWSYESGGRSTHHFSRKHDVILLYGRSRGYRFDLTRVPLARTTVRHNHMRRQMDEDGRTYRSIRSGGKEYRYYDDAPTYPGDVWTDISHLQQRDPERTGYATQKPLRLLERLLLPVVQPGDWVCDLCCGSGTTLAAAQRLGCRFVGLDTEPEALLIARSRLSLRGMTVDVPCTGTGTLSATYDASTGTLTLMDFTTHHPAFPQPEQPFDSLESWSAGYVAQDGFVTLRHFHRSHGHPQLPLACSLPPDMPHVAVLTVDAAGRKSVFLSP